MPSRVRIPFCFRKKQTDIHLFLSGSPKSVSFLGKRNSNGAHEKTGLKPVFDSSVVCCDVVRSKGSDRLLRLACRLPPRLPSQSPSDHSLFECSQDIWIALMSSRVRLPFYFMRTTKKHSPFDECFAICGLWPFRTPVAQAYLFWASSWTCIFHK